MASFQAGQAFVAVVPSLRGFESRLKTELKAINPEVAVKVKPVIDRAMFRDLDQQLGGMDNRTVRVNVKTDGVSQSLIGVAALSRALKTISLPGAVLLATPALLSLASSATAAAGAALLLPAALVAGGAAAGALTLGLGGLGKTMKALGAADEAAAVQSVSAAGQRTAAAKAVTGAQRALETANRGVRDAERNLVDAQADSQRAQEELTQARSDARAELRALQLSIEGAGLAEEEAADRLQEARDRLAEARGSGAGAEEIDDLDRAVRQADLSLREATNRYRELKAEGAEWARTGVEGSDGVRSAQDRVAQSQRGVQDAQTQVRDATLAVRDAQLQLVEAMSEAGSAGEASAAKAAVAFAALSPAGQALVTILRGLGPAWTALRLDVQEKLLAGIGDRVNALAGSYLPILRTSLIGVAGGFNAAAIETSRFLESPAAVGDIATGMDNVTLGVNNASGAMRPLTALFTDLFVVGSTFLPSIGQGFANAAQRAADFVARARETGQLREWIQDGLDVLGQLWQLLKNVDGILGSTFDAADADGRSFLETLVLITGRLDAGLKTPEGSAELTAFFSGLRTIGGLLMEKLIQLWPVIYVGGGAVGALLIAAGPLSSVLFSLVTFALVPLLNTVQFLAPVLGPMIVLFGAWRIATTLATGAMVAWRFAVMLSTAVSVAWQLAMGTNLALTNAQAAAQSRFTVIKYAGIAATNIAAAAQWLWNAATWANTSALIANTGAWIVGTVATIARNVALGVFAVACGIGTGVIYVATAAQWLWNAAMLANPIGLVIIGLTLLVGAFVYAWKNSETFRNIVMGAWEEIKTGLAIAWGVIEFIFNLLKAGFTFVGNLIMAVVKGSIQFAWDKLVSGLQWVRDKFWDAVHWIGDMWGKLRGFLAKPINFLIDVVWNKGLLRAWNAVAGLLPGINPIAPLPLIAEFARGGEVRGPGSPTSDSIPARLSRDEHVWSAREVRGAGGHDQIEAMRNAARQGTLQFFASGGIPAFAGGGAVYQQMFGLIRGAFPNASLNSGYRPGDPGFHGRSKAVDLGTQGRSGGLGHPGLAGMNRWIHDTYGKGSAELIYDGFGDDRPDIYRGRPHTYNPGTRADHRNHVHWAVNDMRDLGGGGLFGAIGGAIGGIVSFMRDKVAGIFRDITDPLPAMLDRTVGVPPPAFKGIPKSLFGKFRDAALSFMLSKADAHDMASGDVGLGGYGKGAPFYVREIARAGRDSGVSRPGNIIGVATALVESQLRMYANKKVPASLNFPHEAVGSDHDSVGLFQQRQDGWGTLAQRMNPYGSAKLFFNKLNTFGWRNMAPGAAAQRVQVSAFPGRYAGRMGEAGNLLNVHAAGGFDQGGWLPPGFGTYFNGTGKNEAVFTNEQLRTLASGTRGGDGNAKSYHLAVYNAANNETNLRTQFRRLEMQEGLTG